MGTDPAPAETRSTERWEGQPAAASKDDPPSRQVSALAKLKAYWDVYEKCMCDAFEGFVSTGPVELQLDAERRAVAKIPTSGDAEADAACRAPLAKGIAELQFAEQDRPWSSRRPNCH